MFMSVTALSPLLSAAPPTPEERLLQAARTISKGAPIADFAPTTDVTAHTGLPFSGIHHHVWFGRADQLHDNNRKRVQLAQQIWKLLRFTPKSGQFDTWLDLLGGFYQHPQVPTDAPAIVLVNPGHVTTRRLATVSNYVCKTLPPKRDDVQGLGGVPPKQVDLQVPITFGGGWKGYGQTLRLRDVPWHHPEGYRAHDAQLTQRKLIRTYHPRAAPHALTRDYITQYSVSDRGPHYQQLLQGNYYPNTHRLRAFNGYNAQGYTDSTVIQLLRFVQDRNERTLIHQLSIAVNQGHPAAATDVARPIANDPGEWLDINAVVRPGCRLLEQQPAHWAVLNAEMAKRR
jgi:hypothetical protein